MPKAFDQNACKTNLKLALTRMNLQKQKKLNNNINEKRAVAELLKAGKDESARVKVEKVIRDDYTVEALDLLHLFCELVLARLNNLAISKDCPVDIKEAVCSIIYAAPRLDIKELPVVRQLFIDKFGKEFALCAIHNHDNCVNPRIVHKLSIVTPENYVVFQYLNEIARAHNLEWKAEIEPEPLPTIQPFVGVPPFGAGPPPPVVPSFPSGGGPSLPSFPPPPSGPAAFPTPRSIPSFPTFPSVPNGPSFPAPPAISGGTTSSTGGSAAAAPGVFPTVPNFPAPPNMPSFPEPPAFRPAAAGPVNGSSNSAVFPRPPSDFSDSGRESSFGGSSGFPSPPSSRPQQQQFPGGGLFTSELNFPPPPSSSASFSSAAGPGGGGGGAAAPLFPDVPGGFPSPPSTRPGGGGSNGGGGGGGGMSLNFPQPPQNRPGSASGYQQQQQQQPHQPSAASSSLDFSFPVPPTSFPAAPADRYAPSAFDFPAVPGGGGHAGGSGVDADADDTSVPDFDELTARFERLKKRT